MLKEAVEDVTNLARAALRSPAAAISLAAALTAAAASKAQAGEAITSYQPPERGTGVQPIEGSLPSLSQVLNDVGGKRLHIVDPISSVKPLGSEQAKAVQFNPADYDSINVHPLVPAQVPDGGSRIVLPAFDDYGDPSQHFAGMFLRLVMNNEPGNAVTFSLVYDNDGDGGIDVEVPFKGPTCSSPGFSSSQTYYFSDEATSVMGVCGPDVILPGGWYQHSGSGTIPFSSFQDARSGMLGILVTDHAEDGRTITFEEGTYFLKKPQVVGVPSSSPVEVAMSAHPNPMSNGTQLDFSTAHQGNVSLGVFDIEGRKVRTLTNGVLNAGPHHLSWDGRDDSGNTVAHGLYFVSLATPDGRSVRRVSKISD